MTLDFNHQLAKKIRTYDLPHTYKVTVGIPKASDSISIASIPGGRTIQMYMDGIVDKEVVHEIVIKTTNKQREALDTLLYLTQALESETSIESGNGSFDYQSTRIVNAPYLQGVDEKNNFFYVTQVASIITIL